MVKYILKSKDYATFDNFVLAVAVVEPLSTLPQIVDVYSSRDVESLSLLSWLLFFSASIVWLIYGLKLRNRPLIASSILWVSTEIALIVGIMLYS